MDSFEFLATLQRLGFIATMVEQTDIAGLLHHLDAAETVAPVIGADRTKVTDIRRFVELSVEYQSQCNAYRSRMAEAEQVAGRTRRQLVGATDDQSTAKAGE